MNLLVFLAHHLPSNSSCKPLYLSLIRRARIEASSYAPFAYSHISHLDSAEPFVLPLSELRCKRPIFLQNQCKPRQESITIGRRQTPLESPVETLAVMNVARRDPLVKQTSASLRVTTIGNFENLRISQSTGGSTRAVHKYSSQASQTSTMPILRSLSCSTAFPSNRQCSNSTCRGLLRQLFNRFLLKKLGMSWSQWPDDLGFNRIMTITSSSRPL